MQAAVPKYVGASFDEAPPGHKFKLYFSCWSRTWEREHLDAPLSRAASIPNPSRDARAALVDRQAHLAASSENVLTVHADTRAPLVTGTGAEHPSDNGFAFLDPHGLPYVPGSSLKGVVRRATEHLALFDDHSSWTIPAVWALFGMDATAAYLCRPPQKESDADRREREHWRDAYLAHVNGLGEAERDLARGLLSLDRASDVVSALRNLPGNPMLDELHWRGALVFWDAYPQCSSLEVDVMTPHFTKYYQEGKAPPSDDGDPKPIYFMVIPQGVKLAIHVDCRPPLGSPASSVRWRDLLASAIDHALDWGGLGAKTSTGYGRAERNPDAERREEARRERELEARRAEERRLARQRKLESLGPLQRLMAELEDCDESRANEIFKDLERDTELGEEALRGVAAALKAAYERLGKWGGKSRKQKGKDAQIRKWLGE